MLNTRISEIFFELLKSGLWGKPILKESLFPLSKEEWNHMYKISINQTVECVIYDAIQLLPSIFQPDKSLFIQWMVRVEKHAQRNEQMNINILRIVGKMKANGIDPMLLKGQGIANCYTNPLRRVCGDVDLCFRTPEVFEKADALMLANGLNVEKSAGFSSSYVFNGFEIEHHGRMFDLHNPFIQRYLRSVQEEEFRSNHYLEMNGRKVRVLSGMQMAIQANAHILKHLLSFGIGIRQLCDSARIYYHYFEQIDPAELKKAYKRLGISKWIDVLHVILVKYLGLSPDKLPSELDSYVHADWMMEEIMIAGNFGFYNSKYEEIEKEQGGRRVDSGKRIWNNIVQYIPYAPGEAIWFPIIQFYSRFKR